MPILPFGPYRPDVTDYQGQSTRTLLNVFPRGDGYGPVPDISAYSSALAAACRGFFYARKNDGTVLVFAGTSTKLYSLNNTDLTWTDVSLGSGSYSALASNAQWQFAQFNNFVFAVHAAVAPQVFDLTSSTEFANLGGSPPQAASIAIVNRFVVLSGLASPNVYRLHWSGLNATTTWTSGVSQSDFQDLTDGGIVRGVSGGEFGIIFQDSAIRRLTYAPGSPYVFGIDRISSDDGLWAPYSLVQSGDRIFFLSPQGFKMLVPGGYPTPIGKERVDHTFFSDFDSSNIQLMIGSSDPTHTRIMWAYKSINGVDGRFDKALIYDWGLDLWSTASISGEYISSLARPGITLEGVDAAFGSDIDALTIGSFDDISNSAYGKLSAIDSLHRLGFFDGANLEATMQTPEQGADGRRIFVTGLRPISDAATVYGSVAYRSTVQSTSSTTTETATNSNGVCPQRIDTRYARGIVRIAAGSTWTYATGVEPEVTLTGRK